MSEVVRSDLDHLSDIGIGSNTTPETFENARKDRDLSRNPPNSSGIILTPVSCQGCQVSTPLTEVCDSLSLGSQLTSSCVTSSDDLNRNHFLSLIKSNSEHLDKTSSASDVVDFGKLAYGRLDGQLCESEYRNKLNKTHNLTSIVDQLTDPTCLRANNLSADYRLMRAALESGVTTDTLTGINQKSDTKCIQAESDSLDISTEFGVPSNLWNHRNCVGVTSADHSFSFAGDTITSLMSNTEIDQDSVLNDGHCSNIFPTVHSNTPTTATIAAKRPITGAHQTARYPAVNKGGMWSSNSNGLSNSALGYMVSNAWSSNGTGVSAKLGSSLVTDSNPTVCDFPGNEGNTVSWSQNSSVHQTLHKPNVQNIPNMVGPVGFGSGMANGSLNRTAVSVGLVSVSTTGVSITSNNKVNEAGLSNIYSMFPKRPQHRMMAHWQQQQQHHQNSQQVPLGKGLMNIVTSSIQLNGNRGSLTGVNSTLSALPNGCEDSGVNNSSGSLNNHSIIQSLNSVGSSSSANSSLVLCSSGDSFTNTLSFNSPTSESSLDSFKYGLDQQLMEVIKSFEISSIGGSNLVPSNANTTSMGGIDDLTLSSNFGEVDQQIPGLNSANQMPVLGSSSIHNSTPMINGSNNQSSGFNSLSSYNGSSMMGSAAMTSPYSMFANIFTREEGFSRKVFVGGLPPDIDEEEITTAFRRFGPLIVDWPHKTESKAYFPPKVLHQSCSIEFRISSLLLRLISQNTDSNGNSILVSVFGNSLSILPEFVYFPKGSYQRYLMNHAIELVQIRPWNLADSDFVMDGSQPLDPRKTIFVGGVPRPLRAIELALIMDRLYGGVCYAGIDTDPELKYPKGAGRVAFSNQQSYIAAISARFVQLQHNEIDKRVEVKPYVLDNQMCDECQGTRCGGKFAPFFCANVTCLQYYCEQCWVQIHSRYGREYHKPLVKEGAERPRPALYRW
ncbi:cytoplasmic polyadenylation element-binding protein [Schistosoma bovis]|uniref:Cytoplasmic polyadenylation element-binding protein n=1 Tax=Schistosoma bovis TaxID=6184 RepID=A0A430QR21_SCHBO|nr:cytoplasmic polyadenylation element-binding protein [Schistosoma bovis]